MNRDTARQQVRDVARRPARLVKAYLAETYDGIGQVVKVAMTRGGVTNAINARIAAGDFGGSRIFPEGTPVIVMVAHGQLEVFLGNLPHPLATFLDTFNNRTLVGEWGLPSSQEDPYTWTDSGTNAGVGVVDGYGYVDLNNSSQYLNQVWQHLDTTTPLSDSFILETIFRYETDQPVDDWLQLIIEVIDNDAPFETLELVLYITRIDFDDNLLGVSGPGHASDSVISHPPNATDLHIKWSWIRGSVQQAKVWWDPDSEPDWQVTIPDSTVDSPDKRLLVNVTCGTVVSQRVKVGEVLVTPQ